MDLSNAQMPYSILGTMRRPTELFGKRFRYSMPRIKVPKPIRQHTNSKLVLHQASDCYSLLIVLTVRYSKSDERSDKSTQVELPGNSFKISQTACKRMNRQYIPIPCSG